MSTESWELKTGARAFHGSVIIGAGPMPFSLAILVLVLVQTWVLQPVAGEKWVPAVAGVVVALGIVHARKSGDWGWSVRALLPGLVLTTAYTVACIVALVLVSRAMGQGEGVEVDIHSLGWLFAWAGAQQWLLQTTFLRETLRIASGRGWILAPLCFGLLHLPNPFLTIATTLAALGWCAIYRRHPNIVPLAVSHAIGTQVILALFDEATTGRLRVGVSYLGLP